MTSKIYETPTEDVQEALAKAEDVAAKAEYIATRSREVVGILTAELERRRNMRTRQEAH